MVWKTKRFLRRKKSSSRDIQLIFHKVRRDQKNSLQFFFYLLSELERFLEALVVHKTSETLDGVQGSDIQILHRGIGGQPLYRS